jgi:flagellar biosynthetic protein FliP
MTWRAALTDRTFIAHYLQMLVAMAAGALLLGPLTGHAGHHGGGTEAGTLLMATTMVAGAAAWAVVRGDGVGATVEMAIAMYASFVVLFPLLWLGVLSPAGLTVVGHLLMLPAMAVAMLRHRDEHRREEHLTRR